jgi:Ran GTPase-activating protein (RanGAP) involved in mRNA processing and transport
MALKVVQSQLRTMQSNNFDTTSVDVSQGGFASASSARNFGRSLGRCCSLARLKLANCSLGHKICAALWEGATIARGLPPALTELDLSSNPHLCFCPRLLSVLSTTTMSKLTLIDCGIAPEKAKTLFRHISRLAELDLSLNNLGDSRQTLATLGSSLLQHGTLSCLQVLRLSGCEIRSQGASVLCGSVGKSKNLRELDLSKNNIGEEG